MHNVLVSKSLYFKYQRKIFQSEKTNQTFDDDILLLDDDDDFDLEILSGDAQETTLTKAASVPVRNNPLIKIQVQRLNQ